MREQQGIEYSLLSWAATLSVHAAVGTAVFKLLSVAVPSETIISILMMSTQIPQLVAHAAG